ncbi:MAG: radical SAM protein [Desulfomonile tiedjei]|nr:radical SAM protein [Desulfomonile tiedjei]
MLREAIDQQMLTPQEQTFLCDHSYVPEHIADYVEAISGEEPFLHEDHLCFFRAGHLIFVGYPFNEATDKAPEAYESACRRFRPFTAAIIAPRLWVGATELNGLVEDTYYRLELPLKPLTADLAYMIRRARRELSVLEGTFGEDHDRLVRSFLAERDLGPGHREIFGKIPQYLNHSSTARVLEARKGDRLVAFNVVDLGSADYCFYLFNFRSLEFNVPGASDLLFYEMAHLAEAEGKKAMNLGLGISPGVRRFKEKWGSVQFLPYTSAFVRRRAKGLFSLVMDIDKGMSFPRTGQQIGPGIMANSMKSGSPSTKLPVTALEGRGRLLSSLATFWHTFVSGLTGPSRSESLTARDTGKRRWRLVQVESTLACNLRCIMCPWKEFRENARDRGTMSEEVWEAIKPHLKDARSVDFTGGGEPLLQPRLAEWIADARSAGCETGVLTNGLLLNQAMAKKLFNAGLNWICVSVDGATKEEYERIRKGSSFEKVCENLASVAKLRTNEIPMVMINFVMMSENLHQLEDIVRLASQLGVDQVNFKQCEVIRGDYGKGHGLFGPKQTGEIKRLQKALARARSLAKKLHVQTTALSLTPTERPVCEQDPTDSLFIRHDGTVAPCISLANGGPTTFLGRDVIMPSVRYGSLPDNDLFDMWKTESCALFRETFQERIRAYEETFLAGLTRGARLTPERLLEEALKKMPKAPEGCTICHYLYGI